MIWNDRMETFVHGGFPHSTSRLSISICWASLSELRTQIFHRQARGALALTCMHVGIPHMHHLCLVMFWLSVQSPVLFVVLLVGCSSFFGRLCLLRWLCTKLLLLLRLHLFFFFRTFTKEFLEFRMELMLKFLL